MNVKSAHILFDTLLREVRTETNLNIADEVKDLYLNSASMIELDTMIGQDRDRIRSTVTYANIGRYYGELLPFLREAILPVHDGDGRFSYGELPIPSTSLISRNLYRNGIDYVVTVESVGFDLTNLTDDLSSDIYIGTPFLVSIDNIVVSSLTNPRGSKVMKKGNIYKIIKSGLFKFTDYGAISNMEGTIFTCSSTFDFSVVSNVNLELEVIAASPNNLGTPMFKGQSSTREDISEPLAISAMVDVGTPFNSKSLIKGVRYRVYKVGTTSFVDFGLSDTVLNATFVCTKSGDPNWGDSPTTLVEVDVKECELIKPVDLEPKLHHAFGSPLSRPISVMLNNVVRVYHLGNFNVNGIIISYAKVPNLIDHNVNAELEFNAVAQIRIVQGAVNLASASLNAANYPPLKNESIDSNIKQ